MLVVFKLIHTLMVVVASEMVDLWLGIVKKVYIKVVLLDVYIYHI